MVVRLFLQRGIDKGQFKLSTICQLHDPCCDRVDCDDRSGVEVIDFDSVKDWFCSQYKFTTLNSVDAVIMSDNSICFIEIKGWREFLKRNLSQRAEVNEKRVEKQVERYDLEEKYADSCRILENIKDLVAFDFTKSQRESYYHARKYFVLVTDICYEEKPLDYIAMGLNFLAKPSVNPISNFCLRLTKDSVDKMDVESVRGVMNPTRQVVIYCKRFDEEIKRVLC